MVSLGRHGYRVGGGTAESARAAAAAAASGARRTPHYATPGWDERTQELREKEARLAHGPVLGKGSNGVRLEMYLAESARRREVLMDSIKRRHATAHHRGATAARELE